MCVCVCVCISTYTLQMWGLMRVCVLRVRVYIDDRDIHPSGSILPSSSSDEFKPFVRKLPEFKFWHSVCLSTSTPPSPCLSHFTLPFRVEHRWKKGRWGGEREGEREGGGERDSKLKPCILSASNHSWQTGVLNDIILPPRLPPTHYTGYTRHLHCVLHDLLLLLQHPSLLAHSGDSAHHFYCCLCVCMCVSVFVCVFMCCVCIYVSDTVCVCIISLSLLFLVTTSRQSLSHAALHLWGSPSACFASSSPAHYTCMHTGVLLPGTLHHDDAPADPTYDQAQLRAHLAGQADLQGQGR